MNKKRKNYRTDSPLCLKKRNTTNVIKLLFRMNARFEMCQKSYVFKIQKAFFFFTRP